MNAAHVRTMYIHISDRHLFNLILIAFLAEAAVTTRFIKRPRQRRRRRKRPVKFASHCSSFCSPPCILTSPVPLPRFSTRCLARPPRSYVSLPSTRKTVTGLPGRFYEATIHPVVVADPIRGVSLNAFLLFLFLRFYDRERA